MSNLCMPMKQGIFAHQPEKVSATTQSTVRSRFQVALWPINFQRANTRWLLFTVTRYNFPVSLLCRRAIECLSIAPLESIPSVLLIWEPQQRGQVAVFPSVTFEFLTPEKQLTFGPRRSVEVISPQPQPRLLPDATPITALSADASEG